MRTYSILVQDLAPFFRIRIHMTRFDQRRIVWADPAHFFGFTDNRRDVDVYVGRRAYYAIRSWGLFLGMTAVAYNSQALKILAQIRNDVCDYEMDRIHLTTFVEFMKREFEQK